MKTRIVRAALAAAFCGVAGMPHAADLSTERTTMPDYCSERNVTCLVPDDALPRPVAAGSLVVTPPVASTSPGAAPTLASPTSALPSGSTAAPGTVSTAPSAGSSALMRGNSGRSGSWGAARAGSTSATGASGGTAAGASGGAAASGR